MSNELVFEKFNINPKGKKLGYLIDNYGKINDYEKELKKIKDEIKEELKKHVKVGNTYEGALYILKVTESATNEYDPATIHKLLHNNDIFFQVVKVSATEVKKVLSPVQLSKAVSNQKVSIRYNSKKKK